MQTEGLDILSYLLQFPIVNNLLNSAVYNTQFQFALLIMYPLLQTKQF